MSKMESINGNESVEDLIAMVDRQDDPAGVIAMISMTTKFTNPATFNQFSKRLKKEKPEIYDKYKEILGGKSKEKSGCFVATATMKNYNHPIVLDLRNFRDIYLLRRWYGRLFIKSYYLISPFFAGIISKSEILRVLSLKLLIRPIHTLLKKLLK